MDDKGKLKYIDIYYKDGNGYSNITDPRFKNNKIFTIYFYDSPYPKIWRTYPINGVDFYCDDFPTEIGLNKPVNFKIYVNDRDYKE